MWVARLTSLPSDGEEFSDGEAFKNHVICEAKRRV